MVVCGVVCGRVLLDVVLGGLFWCGQQYCVMVIVGGIGCVGMWLQIVGQVDVDFLQGVVVVGDGDVIVCYVGIGFKKGIFDDFGGQCYVVVYVGQDFWNSYSLCCLLCQGEIILC